MLVDVDVKKPLLDDTDAYSDVVPQASGSSAAAPTGSPNLDANTSLAVALRQDTTLSDIAGPPPGFAPYEAEFIDDADGNGTIISHDPHLNEDGEALYRFLLSQSQIPPQLFVHISGTHQEQRSHSVHRTDCQGRSQYHTETETVTVTDFSFKIDVSQHIARRPTQWTVPDSEPAYRGTMALQVEDFQLRGSAERLDMETGGAMRRRSITRGEKKRSKAWKEERSARGLPPWAENPSDWRAANQRALMSAMNPSVDVLRSSKTVREWADEYCRSPKMLKEFTYEKVVYGWNFSALQTAITAAIRSTSYSGNVTAVFRRHSHVVHIRADNWLSRPLSNKWVVVLLWITLLYPFLWLFKRFSGDGGGIWQVCGGAYSLRPKQTASTAPQSQDDPPPPFEEHYSPQSSFAAGDEDRGMKEGEWFQLWEGTIKRAVASRIKSKVPLTDPDFANMTNVAPAFALDGYLD